MHDYGAKKYHIFFFYEISIFLLSINMDLLYKVSIGRISNIHERCLHFIQQNYTSDLEILLKDANEKPIIPTRFLGYSKPFMQLYVTKYRVRLYLLLWSP